MDATELRELRKELRYNQKQFGMLWGVHWATVSDWEREIYPVPEHVANWAQVLRDNPTARDQIEKLVGIR